MDSLGNEYLLSILPLHHPNQGQQNSNHSNEPHGVNFSSNVTYYNFSAEEFWAAILEYRKFSVLDARTQVVVIISYATLIAVGLVSNTLVCCVILRQSRRKNSHVSGKSRNLYILNLAVADLSLCCYCMPMALRNLLSFPWTMGIFLCKLTTMFQATHMLVTAGTVSAIAIDRYNTIVHSQSLRNRCHPTTTGGGGAASGVISVWLLSLTLTLPIFIYTRVDTVSFAGVFLYDKCVESWPSPSIQLIYSIFLSSILFIVPTFILSTIHLKISAFLKKHLRPFEQPQPKIEIHSPNDPKILIDNTKVTADIDALLEAKKPLQKEFLDIKRKESTCSDQSQRSESSRKYSDCSDSKRLSTPDISPRRHFLPSFRENSDLSFSFSKLSRESSKRSSRRVKRELKRNRRTTLLLSCIATMYAVSWFPYSVYNIVTNMNPFLTDPPTLYKAFAVTHLMAMSSVCVNPFLYGWLNTNFRCEFLHLFSSLSNCFSKLFKKSSKIITNNTSYNRNDSGIFGRGFDDDKKKKTALSFIRGDKKANYVVVALFNDESHTLNI